VGRIVARNRSNNRISGLVHVTLGASIITCIGLFNNFPDALGGSEKNAAPRMIVTQSHKDAACQANTVETIIGTLGCGGTRKAAHREKTTLVNFHSN
jgi:hypothetical protein